jgi:hypothetical protein
MGMTKTVFSANLAAIKVKSLAGTTGNKHVDALARKSMTSYSGVADTSIRIAGPEEKS